MAGTCRPAACFLAGLVGVAVASDVVLESFASPRHSWKQKNDPVMGGKSTGTFTVGDGVGIFDGEVVNVPFLRAPGFIKVETTDSAAYADVSNCDALTITAKSKSAYAGYRVSFGNAHAPGGKFFAYGYKAHFDAPVGNDFETITIPFAKFSDYWDDATGDLIKTCQDDKKYCPDEATLRNMKTISIWGEGVAGSVHLEIKSIGATGCKAKSNRASLLSAAGGMAKFNNTCSGPIQSNLRYNMSKTDALSDLPLPVPPGESLGEAICCDAAFKAYAEPQHTFARSDVKLFARMNPSGTTTFYDSVCGIPLFEAPKGRSRADFEADTTEHGWPSFRPAELIEDSSHIIEETGEVLSKCGTHLGSYLPDDRGARWCLDLVCVSGNAKVQYLTM